MGRRAGTLGRRVKSKETVPTGFFEIDRAKQAGNVKGLEIGGEPVGKIVHKIHQNHERRERAGV